jgi:ribosomal protein S12 methylthiotransferase accessory factor
MADRIIAPEETWRRIEPHLSALGITRVGDITRLDRIGIPVWIAVRPNSRTLSVAQGKGLDHWAARVSATMESIETALAERPALSLQFARLADLAKERVVVDIEALPRVRNSLFGANRPIHWAEATDWARRMSVWVPYEMVHADATIPWRDGSGSFPSTTNGLASGNVLAEAILHGLCEVVERDALALWNYAPAAQQTGRRLDLESVDHQANKDLLGRFQQAGITPIVWDVTSDIGIAAFRAVIFDLTADAVTRPFPGAFGAGCHPDRNVALARALTEAAQSRLTVIAGSRDDFGRPRYWSSQSQAALDHSRSLALGGGGTLKYCDVPTWSGATATAEIDHIVGRLAAIGIDQVLFIDLTPGDMPIAVARVIVPGLEGPTEGDMYIPGRRVRSRWQGGVS